MTKYIFYILSFLLTVGLSSCQDDFLDRMFDNDGDEVTIDIDFMPVATSELQTRTTASSIYPFPGDGMSNIRDICLVLFDENNSFVEIIDISSSPYTETSEERTEEDTSNGQSTTETTTVRRRYKLQLPTGRFYVYAVANMGRYPDDKKIEKTTFKELTEIGIENMSRSEFRQHRRVWDPTNFRNNSEMSGICTVGALPGGSVYTGMSESAIYVRPGLSLHCWLRRLASKVTVDFDASHLDPSTTIYIKEIRVKDIPYDCSLIADNTATENLEQPHGIRNDEGHGIRLCHNEHAAVGEEEKQHKNWPYLTAGIPTLKDLVNSFDKYTPDSIKNLNATLENIGHLNTSPCIFFYENMQGKDPGKPKKADANLDGVIDSPDSFLSTDPDYKDRVRAGSYVEVVAYYHSLAVGNEGEGKIIYRFMLGKDVIDDYNAERNYHYKLTLCFEGYANDVDWHIEYDSDKPPYSMPNEYYISYGYNEMMEFPISISGTLKDGIITAEIIRNDWQPSLMWIDQHPSTLANSASGYSPYQYGDIQYPTGDTKQVSLGFLSLRKPQNDVIGDNDPATMKAHEAKLEDSHAYIWNAWNGGAMDPGDKSRNQYTDDKVLYENIYNGVTGYTNKRSLGYRVYYFKDLDSKANGDYTYGEETRPEYGDKEDGGFRVYTKMSSNSEIYPRQSTLYIPMYTRERNLCKTTGFTGENPYNNYQRRASVRFRFTVIDRHNREIPVDVTRPIIQVVKIGNPMGIWRAWNNAAPFDVQLKYLNDDGETFSDLTSHEGGWSAEVEQGADWILLNGGRKKVTGDKDSKIHFTYRPIGILSNPNQVRCGIITVRYHNFSCIHKIFVRQGYAPLKINNDGAAYHTGNLVTKDTEAQNPCDEGSLFRAGNLDQPIDAENNVNDESRWVKVTPNMFKDHSNDKLKIAGTNDYKTWDEITSKGTISDFKWDPIKINGKTCKIISVANIVKMRDGNDSDTERTRYQFGVLYSDKATSTGNTLQEAWHYKQANPTTHSYGMRGCFVYNNTDGRQIFFPIGSSGYGKRKALRNTTAVSDELGWATYPEVGKAVVRYSTARITYMKVSGASCLPLLWDIFRSDGAAYWCNAPENTDPKHTDEKQNRLTRTSLDLNYKTFDFNTLGNELFGGNGNGEKNTSDACFIRLVDE